MEKCVIPKVSTLKDIILVRGRVGLLPVFRTVLKNRNIIILKRLIIYIPF